MAGGRGLRAGARRAAYLRGSVGHVWNPKLRLGLALLVWVAAVAASPLLPVGLPWPPRILLGFAVAGLWFAGTLVWHLRRKDAAETRAHAAQEDPGRGLTDVVVTTVGLLTLVADGGMLVFGGDDPANDRWVAIIAILTVAAGWMCVHSVYALRYARLYYADDDTTGTPADGTPADGAPIDFNQAQDPRYTDFLYFSFNLGMTYQVSDTTVRSARVRRVVLGHCIQSWVFGTVVIASAVNLVGGLSG